MPVGAGLAAQQVQGEEALRFDARARMLFAMLRAEAINIRVLRFNSTAKGAGR